MSFAESLTKVGGKTSEREHHIILKIGWTDSAAS